MGVHRFSVPGGRSRSPAVLLALTLSCWICIAAPASAMRPPRRHRTITVRRSFHLTGTAGPLAVGERYVFMSAYPYAAGAPLGTLLDERTGTRTPVSRPGCRTTEQSQNAGPWLLFDCTQTTSPVPELYSLATGQWQTVTPVSPIETCPEGLCGFVTYRATDVGSQWLEFRQTECSMGEHCSGENVFQNLHTNQIADDPTGGETIADLDSASLGRRLCRPLLAPAPVIDAPGGLDVYGRFAIALGPAANGAPETFLERCRSKLHELLTRAPFYGASVPMAADSQAVIWLASPRELKGVWLPSLQHFAMAIPLSVDLGPCAPPDLGTCLTQIALSSKSLFLLTPTGQLWRAHRPTPPPSPQR